MLICLDPGHAGQSIDPGAISVSGTRESDINLSIAFICAAKLKSRGHSVLMTRTMPEDPAADDLAYRCHTANNAQCDYFVSIHCNSAANSLANGWEVFYHPESTRGQFLAQAISSAMSALPLSERGVKSQYFYVLKHTVMPAILIECAFLSNHNDERYLTDMRNQSAIAAAIVSGIVKYAAGGENT